MRLRLLVAYDGTRYSGWQVQAQGTTIQGSLETAFLKLSGQHARVIGSGRTDAGVHALGQVAHVDLSDSRPAHIRNWQYSLNCVLPADIRILKAVLAPESFHARKNVLSKTYIYRFWQSRDFYPPLMRNQIWACGVLNKNAILEALPYLKGEHDFATFQNAGTPLESTVRTIFDISLREEPVAEFLPEHFPVLRLSVTATGFLKQMARNIAGLLFYIGTGRIGAVKIPELLNQRNRQKLPSPTAPACGLSLVNVQYSGKDSQNASPTY